MGTKLMHRGLKLPLPLWAAQANINEPEIVKAIHKDYLDAGADIITTNTFRTTPRAYLKTGIPIDDAYKLAELSIKQAEEISKRLSFPKLDIEFFIICRLIPWTNIE